MFIIKDGDHWNARSLGRYWLAFICSYTLDICTSGYVRFYSLTSFGTMAVNYSEIRFVDEATHRILMRDSMLIKVEELIRNG